jgi:hypothetical protein
MANNSYAQLIDDFEKGILVIEGESLTDYIKRMGGVDYESKANGGIMGYAVGGRTQNLDQYGLQYGEGLNPYAPDVQIDNMPTNRGYKNFDDQEVGIINTDISNQMADLSKGQMKALNNPITKFNIMDSNTNPQSRDYNTILNDVGFRAQDIKGKPPTKQNIIDYYNGTYKPQARLSNEEYLSRNNNLTANANNIGRDFTFDTTSPVPEDIDMQYTVGNEFNVAPQNRSMFERGKDLASSGIAKAGKVGMDAFNLIKNNNPIGLLTSGFGKLGDMFEYKGGDVTVDENGNIISAADLNKMNARGGYYTDAARNARNRTKSLAAFRAREATDSKRYKDLLLQEIKQTKARAEAKAKAAAQLRAANTGYTSRGTAIDFGDYYNSDGTTNTSSASNPSNSVGPTSNFGTTSRAAKGGLIGYQNGGLATMFRQKR